MQLSVVLNVALVVGILALLPAPQAVGAGARVCATAPANVAAFDVAHLSKVRDRAAGVAEGPARVVRKSARVKTGSETAPMVAYIRCRQN